MTKLSGDSLKALWFTLLIVVVFFFFSGHGFSDQLGEEDLRQMAGYGEEKLSTVLVTGSLLCESCSHGETHLHAWPISGATVGVNCHGAGKKDTRASDWVHGVSDEYGDFIIDIPSHLHATPTFHKACSVKILRVPKSSRCRPAHIAERRPVQLSSFGSGIRTYTSGVIRVQHRASKPLQACEKGNVEGIGAQQSLW